MEIINHGNNSIILYRQPTVIIPDNSTSAISFQSTDSKDYIKLVTTNNSEAVSIQQNITGNSTSTTQIRQFIPSSIDSRTYTGLLRVTYDFATDGGTVAGTPVSLAQSLPDNAVVTRGYYEVITQFTSGTSNAEIALGIATDDVDGFLAATIIGTSGTSGFHELIQNGTASNFSTKTTASRAIQLDVTVEDLTDGKLVIFLEYIISE